MAAFVTPMERGTSIISVRLSWRCFCVRVDIFSDDATGLTAGNQHWGHATSKDLYHWENQPIAIFPDSADQAIFSGSAVVDANNTSGFFPNQDNGVVAIYTLNTAIEQTQNVAYSLDGGFTFIKYANNPVVSVNSSQFRDPKVIWFENHWVMIVSYAQDFVIGIYTSPDLISWIHASNFSHHGLLGLQYECPNMVSMPMDGANASMYLMVISINPGAPLGGSAMQYFPGSFNGTHFEAIDGATRLTDFGKDSYAGQFFSGVPDTEDQVFIAWSSNWQYSQLVPTGPLEGWRSTMSLPRQTRLANVTRIGYDLISTPYDLSPLYSGKVVSNSAFGNGSLSVDYSAIPSGALYFKFNVSSIPIDGTAQGTLNFTFFASSTNESVSGGYFFSGDTPFWLNRGNTKGFDNPFFTDKFSYNKPIATSGSFVLEGVLDRSILEVFLDGGEASATTTFFPVGSFDTMLIATAELNSTVVVLVEVWALKSAWADLASSDGIVCGNVTAS